MIVPLVLLLVAYGTASPAPKADPVYRLPEGAVEVEHYDIKLLTAADIFVTDTFKGEVIVKFKNLLSTSEVKLHANKINFTLVELLQEDGQKVDLANTEFPSDPVTDIVTFTASTPLEQGGTYELTLHYDAILRTDEMYGFYKSYYIDTDGTTRKYLGTTQFQATSARKAFPCFDEPSYKATFKMTIRHSTAYTAVSNTPGVTEPDEEDNNYSITTFKETPRMSTYLIAFVVSDFTCTDSTEVLAGGLPHTVCSRKETEPLREVALNIGPKLVKVLENFTNIEYQEHNIGKMHEFAIPDFSAGAMENYGLLTYRETGLLYDPEQASNSYKQSISNVISHEIAHMWFGNLVTTHWWSDTFLNEGFARFFQYFATAEVETTWELDKQFVTAQVQSMLNTDSQPSAAALSAEANSPSEVSSRFASVSYNKGASVLRMIQHTLGAEKFKAGIQQYLQDHKFNNTKPADLYAGLQTVVDNQLPEGTTIEQVMSTWVNQAGSPVISVELDGTDVKLSQKRFLVSGVQSNEAWYIPISYTLSRDEEKFLNTSAQRWLVPNENVTLDNVVPEQEDWIILNNQQTGYYRVNYDGVLLKRIEEALLKDDFSGIIDINRAQLVDDSYNLAKINTYTYRQLFSFWRFLANDTSYYPWYAALTAFSNMLQRTGDERIRESLGVYILTLMDELYKSVPFGTANDDNQIYSFNRVQAQTWACRLGKKECIDNARAEFEKYKNGELVDKNLKSVIICNGLRHSTAARDDWEKMWNTFSTSRLATEQATILTALGCSKDQDVINDFLFKSIDKNSGIRQQDASSVFSTVYTQNPEGVDYAFDFILNNYQNISEHYGSMNALNNMFSGLAGRFTTKAQIDRLQGFIDNTEGLTESLISAAKAAIQNAQANLEWTQNFENQMKEYFSIDTGTADTIRIGFATVILSAILVVYQLF